MRGDFKKALHTPFLWGVIILTLMLIFSFKLRQQDFKRMVGAQNSEATYHVLFTIKALNENPVENHWYLPTVTLGRAADKYIPWGSCVPTKTGDYIYTSFPVLGFLAPYFWFKAFQLEPSVENLAYFNFFLGSLSAVALFLLLESLLKFNGYDPSTSAGGALVGSTIGIFSREALQSHGLVYWSHSLYQPILVFSLYLLFKYLTSEAKETRLVYVIAIIVATFLGSMLEWTGYIFNSGLIVLFWLQSRDSTSSRALAIQILISTLFAGVLTIAHFSFALGFEDAINGFLGRFLVRNTSAGNLFELIRGYGLSYGWYIVVIIFLLAYYSFRIFGNRQLVPEDKKRVTLFIFTAACIPLLENIVMLQHATQFSFDRLKFIFPSSLILAFSFAHFEAKSRILLWVLILFSCFHGYKSYRADLSHYSSWIAIDADNRRLASRISEKADMGCSVFLSNLGVRGYANLLFHRGMYEHKSIQETLGIMTDRNACASVFLEGTKAFSGRPKYTRAIVTQKDGSSMVLTNEDIK